MRTALITTEHKPLSSLQAQAALAGFSCCQTPAGNVVLSRFGGSWIFDTIELATGWLSKLERTIP